MTERLTTEEWAATFGRQLRDLRLRQNVDQRQLAEQAGVALNVVKNLEAGKGATVKSLVKVLRTLGRAEWLETLAPAVSISPLQLLKSKQPRQRASKVKGRNGCLPRPAM
jgi:transcriptional regulator with XRE-family HTH domain